MESLTTNFIEGAPYIGILLAMTVNGFLNFPSSQILYPILGMLAEDKGLSVLWLIFFGAVGNATGNIISYELARAHGVTFISRHFPNISKALAEIDRHIKGKSFFYLLAAKLIPAVKSFVPIYAGLNIIGRAMMYSVFLLSSILWAAGLIGLGYMMGGVIPFHYYWIVVVSLLSLMVLVNRKKLKFLLKK